MFTQNTALLLGAGASVHFGIPLGNKLKSDIASAALSIVRRARNVEYANNFKRLTATGQFKRSPAGALVFDEKHQDSIAEFLETSDIISLLNDLGEKIQNQTAPTIDRFLDENPSLLKIGKLMIAAIVIQNMYEEAGHRKVLMRKQFQSPIIAGVNNWYSGIVNELRRGAGDVYDLRKNKLDVVTFNYDTSLEIFLDHQFATTEKFQDADWHNCVTIHHPHGCKAPTLCTIS